VLEGNSLLIATSFTGFEGALNSVFVFSPFPE
jgi:hypothetical protein